MHKLPKELRKNLREPLGSLVSEEELIKLLKNTKNIVSVGDLVTFTLLKNGIIPVICIVDYIIQRKDYPLDIKEKISKFGKKHIKIKNPPGTISKELWDAIASSYKSINDGPICLEIDGEEDLAALPAIYLAPGDATIIYGMPNKGVVVVKPTELNKEKVKKILNRM